MRTGSSILTSALLISSLFGAWPALAQDQAPPLIKQINNGNWLTQNEAESLRDELYYQRAIHAYITMLPALNTIGMRDGSEATFGKGYNILPIWKDRMDSRTWVPTPNADVIYSMNYLDLKQTGPLVVAAPRDVIGMFTDFFQRTITDVGAIGPDRARGGLYLLLPQTTLAKFRRATSHSSLGPTMCSSSSALLCLRVKTDRTRSQLSLSPNRHASIHFGRLRRTSSRCSFRTVAANVST